MNKYQKKLNKLVKYAKLEYEYMWKDYKSFRWHRCQERAMRKNDNENNLEGIESNLKSAKCLCREDGLI